MGVSTDRSKKGTISISPYKEGLRLRWRVRDKRHELYLSSSIPFYETKAYQLKMILEQDLKEFNFDETLNRYKRLLKQAAQMEQLVQQLQKHASISRSNQLESLPVVLPKERIDVVKEFDRYLVIKDKVNDTNYYALTRKILVKWGTFELDDVPELLSREKWSAKTFNDRRNCLNAFFDWMKRKKKILDNPLDDVSNRERERMHEDREPFTDSEAAVILNALRTDQFRKKSSRYSHSQYYPFVAFLLHVGCRPAEAIGLKVRFVKFDNKTITIGNSLARTANGTHASAREYKSTKNKKVRLIPMDAALITLLKPLCRDKQPDDFVFLNENGRVIDDKMFLRRVFKPIQEALKIPYRVTYACRHTFATRAVRQGIKPHELAYLMGDTVETVLSNYFHNNCMPASLPSGILSISDPTMRRAS